MTFSPIQLERIHYGALKYRLLSLGASSADFISKEIIPRDRAPAEKAQEFFSRAYRAEKTLRRRRR